MSGQCFISISDAIMVVDGGVAVKCRHVFARAIYDDEGECRSAYNDVLETYASGRECLFRHRGAPESENDVAAGCRVWGASLRFTALDRPGPWHKPPERHDVVVMCVTRPPSGT